MSRPLGPVLEVRTLYPSSRSNARIVSRNVGSSSMTRIVHFFSEGSAERLSSDCPSEVCNPPLPNNAAAAVKIPIYLFPLCQSSARALNARTIPWCRVCARDVAEPKENGLFQNSDVTTACCRCNYLFFRMLEPSQCDAQPVAR